MTLIFFSAIWHKLNSPSGCDKTNICSRIYSICRLTAAFQTGKAFSQKKWVWWQKFSNVSIWKIQMIRKVMRQTILSLENCEISDEAIKLFRRYTPVKCFMLYQSALIRNSNNMSNVLPCPSTNDMDSNMTFSIFCWCHYLKYRLTINNYIMYFLQKQLCCVLHLLFNIVIT